MQITKKEAKNNKGQRERADEWTVTDKKTCEQRQRQRKRQVSQMDRKPGKTEKRTKT